MVSVGHKFRGHRPDLCPFHHVWGLGWGGLEDVRCNHPQAPSLESLAVDAVGWGPAWVCGLGHPRVASPCAWASSQHGGWLPGAGILRERARWKLNLLWNLVLEITQRLPLSYFICSKTITESSLCSRERRSDSTFFRHISKPPYCLKQNPREDPGPVI